MRRHRVTVRVRATERIEPFFLSLWVSAAPSHDGARGLAGASGTLCAGCGPQQTPPSGGSPASTSFGASGGWPRANSAHERTGGEATEG
jgi:hypothetical protein